MRLAPVRSGFVRSLARSRAIGGMHVMGASWSSGLQLLHGPDQPSRRQRLETCTRPQRLAPVDSAPWLFLTLDTFCFYYSRYNSCSLHVRRSSVLLDASSTMAAGTLQTPYHVDDFSSGGTGARLARAVIIVAGVCALVASFITFVSVSLSTCHSEFC